MPMDFREAFLASFDLEQHFNLTNDQMEKLADSPQLLHIMEAVKWRRWDQVTVMLYQDDILERKTAKK